jgi:pimeloyl-ACP methyl ester carboxylesterase
MRAKLPVEEGFVERDGVKLHYEVYGSGAETIVFVPPWSLVHSRVYKGQLPYFSERFRCVTYDGRGNGQSDRPDDVAAYTLDNYVADALAVMDATRTGSAVLVGLSYGAMVACILAAHHAERVKAAILVGTAAVVGPNYPYMTMGHFHLKRSEFEDWGKYNYDYWFSNYPDFAAHFVGNMFCEPHSTKQIEDGVAWACDTTGPILARTVEARTTRPAFDVDEAMYRKIKCPLLMIHGDNDRIQPYARGQVVAELTGAEFVTIEGGGHNPLGRIPAKCNILIAEFLDRKLGLSARPKAVASQQRAKRALYLSSPIGLGHAAETSPSPENCARSFPTSRSTGWRRTPSRGCSKQAAKPFTP